MQAGVLPRALTPALVRAVHRITRGNCVVRDMPIEEPLLGMPAEAAINREAMANPECLDWYLSLARSRLAQQA